MDSDRTQILTTAAWTPEPGEDTRIHCLTMVDGPDAGRRHLIGAAGLSIGRAPPADIVLADSQVSRLHCRISLVADQVIVEDRASTNGTFVEGVRIQGEARLGVGDTLQVGHQSFKYDRLTGRQFQKADELDRDLAAACSYVLALLPPPVREGAIRVDWHYQPCAKLGGDAFGYVALDENTFVGYLIDVSGHGAGAAMHSVAVMNLLRQRALPDTNMANPSQVLQTLNTMFQMEDHAEMYFTMWYGVYDRTTRELRYASAGHHPAYMASPDRSEVLPLGTRNGLIGAMPGKTYASETVTVPSGASIYVFSDGVFEIVTKAGVQWSLSDFLPLIAQPRIEGLTEPDRLYGAVRSAARPGDFDDDFSLVVLTFD